MPNTDTKLEKARKIINEVDAKMRELFLQRMEAAHLVADYKKERGLAIFDPIREEDVYCACTSYLGVEALRSYLR